MRILAIMSGSSLDGLDIGVIEINFNNPTWNYKIIDPVTYSYSETWVDLLQNAYKLSGEDLINLDFQYAELCSRFIEKYKLTYQESYSCISYHGHTIFHNPNKKYTFQLGKPATIAALCKTQVIADFRSTDVSLSGQGAPLMAMLDKLLFHEYAANINLGGICNISAISGDNITAYDIAPCNQLLNALANQVGIPFDKDGELALKGKRNEFVMEFLEKDNYFLLKAPKSLDNNYIRECITEPLLKLPYSLEDKMKSCIEFISLKISQSISDLNAHEKLQLGDSVLFTGGGALNPVLTSTIKTQLSEIEITPVFPSKTLIEYKELLLMGMLAYLRVENKSNVLAKFTGASRDSISGAIYEG